MSEILNAGILRRVRDHRNRELAISKSIIERYKDEEIMDQQGGRAAWSPQNAELNGGDHSFDLWFRRVLPEGYTSLQGYIEQTLSPFQFRRGLEIGGVGSRLFGGFTPGFFHSTAGMSLTDLRKKSLHPDLSAEIQRTDEALNHTVIQGNLLSEEDKQKVITWSNGEKVHVIFERMYAGIGGLPDDPFFLSNEVNFWYSLLAEGGLFFAQIPEAFMPYMKEWESYIKADFHGQLDVQVDSFDGNTLLRLHKLENAPENLPLLNPHAVLVKEAKRRGFFTTRF